MDLNSQNLSPSNASYWSTFLYFLPLSVSQIQAETLSPYLLYTCPSTHSPIQLPCAHHSSKFLAHSHTSSCSPNHPLTAPLTCLSVATNHLHTTFHFCTHLLKDLLLFDDDFLFQVRLCDRVFCEVRSRSVAMVGKLSPSQTEGRGVECPNV